MSRRVDFGRSKLFILFELSVIVGFVLSQYFHFALSPAFFIICISLLLIAIYLHKKLYFVIILLFLIGAMIGHVYIIYYKTEHYPDTLPYDSMVEIEGIVSDYPDIRDDNIKYKININKVLSDCDDCSHLVDQTILLTTDKYTNFHYNDILHVKGVLEKPQNFNTSTLLGAGNFDYEAYLSCYDIFALIRDNQYKEEDLSIELIGHNDTNRWVETIYFLKDNLNYKLSIILPEPESGLLNALLLGNKRTVDPKLYEIMTLIGISHIIVVSGYHVTVIIKIIADSTRRLSRWQFFILSNVILVGLIVITGISPSVIRAAIMAELFVLARLIGRKGILLPAFTFTCFLLVLQNPLILFFDLGFQLSVLSVLGILYITPIFEDKLFKRKNLLSSTLAATFGAQIMVSPFLIYEFGRFSILAPLANLFVVPIIPTTMGVGLFGLVVSFVNMIAGQWLSYISWLLLRYIIIISTWFSHLPVVSVNITIDKWYYIVGIYIVIFITIFIVNNKVILRKHNKV